MSKIKEKLEKVPAIKRDVYPNQEYLTEFSSIFENVTTRNKYDYEYDVVLRLGSSVICGEDEIEAMREYVIRGLLHELYGEIYQKLIKLRINLVHGNSDENRELLNELINDTRS